jgi:gliding motility-associated-like protein
MSPAPQAGTRLAVAVVPYEGYGCPDTLYANLVDTLTVKALAGNDKRICHGKPEELGFPPKPGILYQWSPATGLSDINSANPFANPELTTQYILTSRSFGGGCMEMDTVTVASVKVDTSLRFLGSYLFCEGYGDSAVLQLTDNAAIQWYRDNKPIEDASGKIYNVTQSGAYYAELSKEGCTAATGVHNVLIEPPKPGVSYPVLYLLANSPATLQARSFGQTVAWQPANFLTSPTTGTPVFTGSADEVYTIQITTAAGCITIDTQAVKIVTKVDIMVPTAFTPNGDGRNDILRPFLFGLKELVYFRVYNRWGQLLYETKTQHQGWNGRYGGKLLGNEVVVWIAEGIGMDGTRHSRKGTTVCVQ